MVKRPGCVSHFLSSEAQRKRKAICCGSSPDGGKQLLLMQLPERPPEAGTGAGDISDGQGGGGGEDSEVAALRLVTVMEVQV